MPGITGYIGSNINQLNFINHGDTNEDNLIKNRTKSDSFYFERKVNQKFINDKVFFEDDNYLIITDGVLLNSRQLMAKYQEETLEKTLISMYKNKKELFFQDIRGSYSCVFHDKNEDLWLIYTDQVGDKKVYYSLIEGGILLGSRSSDLSNILKDNNNSLSLDEESCLCMLTFGYMIDDNTLFKEIKKLLPGHYIKVESKKIEIKRYFQFNNTPTIFGNEDEIIDELDRLFRDAVKLQFDKDQEYGYKHIASLSGGLDSRMVNFVAHDLGYKNLLNYTFSQSNYLDEKIAKQIAVDLNHEFIFKSLDDAKFLLDIENVVKISGGTSIYYGMAHSKNNLESLNLAPYGLVHTGQLGDVIVGSFSKSRKHEKVSFSEYVYSTKYKDRLDRIEYINYENDELFKMYNRGFNFALNGNLSFQEQTESFSPFYNLEFMQFCLNIPLEKRINHNLYYKWILRKYPAASHYIYEKIKSKITTPRYLIKSKNLSIKIVNKVLKTLKLPALYGYNAKRGMNPFDYWYRKNQDLKEFIISYYKENIDLLDSHKSIKIMCQDLYRDGITVEKIQVLTILATVKVFIGDNR
ncbi:asparagine synthase-related protein [Oceanobacillus sp. Castelsardo]|uniref:asparagine synthase-related protein n=1 Tax=Oceanobacillus sp. Castelsardo TaxID=1851204 RepID=UPI00083835B8|nr:asparagine synthase-related protein [Oceanobacillus sp. Castelsardo]